LSSTLIRLFWPSGKNISYKEGLYSRLWFCTEQRANLEFSMEVCSSIFSYLFDFSFYIMQGLKLITNRMVSIRHHLNFGCISFYFSNKKSLICLLSPIRVSVICSKVSAHSTLKMFCKLNICLKIVHFLIYLLNKFWRRDWQVFDKKTVGLQTRRKSSHIIL
jgi:hypothetical protein